MCIVGHVCHMCIQGMCIQGMCIQSMCIQGMCIQGHVTRLSVTCVYKACVYKAMSHVCIDGILHHVTRLYSRHICLLHHVTRTHMSIVFYVCHMCIVGHVTWACGSRAFGYLGIDHHPYYLGIGTHDDTIEPRIGHGTCIDTCHDAPLSHDHALIHVP